MPDRWRGHEARADHAVGGHIGEPRSVRLSGGRRVIQGPGWWAAPKSRCSGESRSRWRQRRSWSVLPDSRRTPFFTAAERRCGLRRGRWSGGRATVSREPQGILVRRSFRRRGGGLELAQARGEASEVLVGAAGTTSMPRVCRWWASKRSTTYAGSKLARCQLARCSAAARRTLISVDGLSPSPACPTACRQVQSVRRRQSVAAWRQPSTSSSGMSCTDLVIASLHWRSAYDFGSSSRVQCRRIRNPVHLVCTWSVDRSVEAEP